MTTPTITLTPQRAALLDGFETTVDVLVRVGAPPRPSNQAKRRPPLHLALVIDRSGSMNGAPLREAKRAAQFVVAGLTDGDRASLVTFDDAVETRLFLSGTGHRAALHAAIEAIEPGGSTNLHGGWFAGAETLAPHVIGEGLSRVILLSDGGANAGLRDPAAIFRQCEELAEAGVTTSTYGLGEHFNEDLMIGMARSGMGNQYYGQTADDLMDPFREELALLEALCARNPRLMLKPAAGIGMKVLNNYPVTAEGHVRLPALAYDGEAWALLRLTVPAGLSATAAPLVVAQLAYTTLDGDECITGNQALTLPRVPAAAYGAIAEDELVARRSAEVAVAQLQVRARSAAQQHQWNEVDALLKQSQKIAKDNPWASSVIEELSQLAARRDSAMYAKEAAYSSRRMCARLAPQQESAELSISDEPMFLRRKSAQGKQAPKP